MILFPFKDNILLPLANTPYMVYDTIEIKLMVEFVQAEVSLKISLLDANYSSASPISPQVFSNFETDIETTILFIIDSKYQESDHYYLYFKVSDKFGGLHAYRSIYIEGLQQQFEGSFIVSEFSANQTGIEKLETDLSDLGIKVLAGNYAGSAIDSRGSLVYMVGQNSGNLIALNTDGLTHEWEVPIVPNPVQPYFTFLEQINQVLYAGFYNGEVNGYSPSGNLMFSIHTDGLTFSNPFCIAGNTLVGSSKQSFRVLAGSLFYGFGGVKQ